MQKGIVKINFTIGFGNNIFQYCFGRLLAEKNSLQLSHGPLDALKISSKQVTVQNNYETIVVNDQNYKKVFYSDIRNKNLIINGYFEDYKIFKPYLEQIYSWFPPSTIERNTEDVIIHLRMQNRLIQEAHHKNHISFDSFKKALENFSYNNVHIVTDLEKWDIYNRYDIEKIQHEISLGPNRGAAWVSTEQSLEYINHLVSSFAPLRPIVHTTNSEVIHGSGGLRGDFVHDFNLIRSFEQVVIHNSTFSWWGAVLGNAKKVAIFDPWKIAKPASSRRNLGKTSYPGWFSWGSSEDLYFTKYNINV